MFEWHDKPWTLAGFFAFRIAAILLVVLASMAVFQTARAQVRIGIGGAGIGAIILNDALSRPQYQNDAPRRRHYQNANPDADSTKKITKNKNRKHAKEDKKIAKRSTRNDASSAEKPSITGVSPITSPKAETSRTTGTSTTADKFGD